jgi:hypothetical protein
MADAEPAFPDASSIGGACAAQNAVTAARIAATNVLLFRLRMNCM